jgi:prophage regulatory protein
LPAEKWLSTAPNLLLNGSSLIKGVMLFASLKSTDRIHRGNYPTRIDDRTLCDLNQLAWEDASMVSGILRLPAVMKLTGLSRSSIHLMISGGSFPRQVSLGARAVGWRESDIHDWLDNLSRKRPQAIAP